MKLLVGVPGELTRRRFKTIQDALDHAHRTKLDLYEDDDGDLNLIYSHRWDVSMRRTVWRTLRSEHGLSPMVRMALPVELRDGTIGPDFEVQ